MQTWLALSNIKYHLLAPRAEFPPYLDFQAHLVALAGLEMR